MRPSPGIERRADMWINTLTGEIYSGIAEAIRTIISDMMHIKACRTIKMLSVKRFD